MTQYELDNMLCALRREHEERASALRKELQALNEEYAERKKALMEDYSNIKGARKPDGYNQRRDYHAMRRLMVRDLRRAFENDPNVDAEHINVKFHVEGENVSFETIIPKKCG